MAGDRARRAFFSAGVLTGLLAQQLVLFAVPLIIYRDTGEVSTLGLAYALEWLPNLVAYPFAGVLVDRDGGVRLFSRANVARAVLLGAALALCLARPGWSTPVLMANGALLSTAMAGVHLSVEKVVPRLSAGEQLARTQSLVQNMELLAMALGPGLAVGAVLVLGKVGLLGLAGAMFAAAAACWLPLPRFRPDPVERPAGNTLRDSVAEIRQGWRLMVRNRPVLMLAGFNFAINLVLSVALAANAAVVTGVFKAPESSFALLNTCVGVMGLVNLLLIPLLLRRFDVRALGVIGFTGMCAATLLLGLASSFTAYALAFVGMLVAAAYFNVFNRTQRVRVIAQEHLGKVMGSFFIINDLAFPLAGALLAAVGGTAGPQRLTALLTVPLALFGAVFLPLTIRGFQRALSVRPAATTGTAAAAGGQP
ncbi:MFS transporter [Streptomyces sp. NPDC059467]|uniref:MFS transporter n=1 Tax=Streptomyces sp. NPDC059467 TaxID=3346844 RepID=UPI0036800C54